MKDTLGRENRVLPDHVCPQCGTTFRPPRKASRYCSRPCMWKNNGGQNRKSEVWWVNGRGYVEGRIEEAGDKRRVKHHRLIAEQVIGRRLLPNEDVHHLDGDKQNNSPENLQVVTHSEHSRITNSERTYKRGYRLNLTDQERRRRAEQMRAMRTSEGREAQP